MTKYEKQILNTLLDKYERSKSFTGTNQVNQSFTIKPEVLFPKYKDDSEFDLFFAVNESIEVLVQYGYIKAKSYNNGVIQQVALNVSALSRIYAYLGRNPKTDIVSELRRLLLEYKDANDILSAYCICQLERLEVNKSVKFYDDNLFDFKSILKIVSEITNVQNETFERDFSIKILGDSKAFGEVLGNNQIESDLLVCLVAAMSEAFFPDFESVYDSRGWVSLFTRMNYRFLQKFDKIQEPLQAKLKNIRQQTN